MLLVARMTLALLVIAATAVRAGSLLVDTAALAAWMAEKSPAIAAANERVRQVEEDARSAHLLPNPTLDATVSDLDVTPSNPSGLLPGETLIQSYGLTELIELGKRGPRQKAARARVEAARADARALARDAVADARTALARALWTRLRSDALEASTRAGRAALALSRARVEHGDLAASDFDRMALEEVSVERDAAHAAADAEDASFACRALLQLDCAVDGGEALLDEAAALPAPLPSAADAARTRPESASLAAQREAAGFDERLARAKAIPDPALRAGYVHDALEISGDQLNTVGLTVTLPLPVFDRGQHDAARARAHAHELESLAAADRAGALASVSGLLARRERLERERPALEDAARRSGSVLAAAEKAFAAGSVSLTDLLLARRTDRQLALAVLDARFELFAVRNELRRSFSLDLTP